LSNHLDDRLSGDLVRLLTQYKSKDFISFIWQKVWF